MGTVKPAVPDDPVVSDLRCETCCASSNVKPGIPEVCGACYRQVIEALADHEDACESCEQRVEYEELHERIYALEHVLGAGPLAEIDALRAACEAFAEVMEQLELESRINFATCTTTKTEDVSQKLDEANTCIRKLKGDISDLRVAVRHAEERTERFKEVLAHKNTVNTALKSALNGDASEAIAGALADGEAYGRVCEQNRFARERETLTAELDVAFAEVGVLGDHAKEARAERTAADARIVELDKMWSAQVEELMAERDAANARTEKRTHERDLFEAQLLDQVELDDLDALQCTVQRLKEGIRAYTAKAKICRDYGDTDRAASVRYTISADDVADLLALLDEGDGK